MKAEDLCMGCMSDREEGAVCLKCGWKHGAGPASPLYLEPGTILNKKYIIGRVLGYGGFGITYLAWDKVLDIKLCIKEFLPRDLAARSANLSGISVYTGESRKHFQYGLDKFLEEGRALARFVNHPGIVSVRDYFKENNTAYLVMLYLEGITLKEYLKEHGDRIDYDTALNIMMPVMDALREVHKIDMLHRDISPDNIYITKEGQIKILDFGAARYSMGEHSRSLSVILKPGFAPEEQYRSKGKQGPWTDIYAVGATFYKAITGMIPPESLDRLHEDTLIVPSEKGVSILSNAEQALIKAMSVRAGERFQTMEAFQEALTEEEIRPDPPLPESEPPVPGPESEKISKPKITEPEAPKAEERKTDTAPDIRKKKPGKMIIGVIAAVFVFAIVLVLLSSKKNQNVIEPVTKMETPGVQAVSSDEETKIAEPKQGQPWQDPVTGIEFVWVPKGCFQMGSNSNEENSAPLHEVCVDGFWMGKYEVTQAQWKKIMGNNPLEIKGDNLPVYDVSWNDVQTFISKLKLQPGYRFSLPTEAQWEYAARSGGKNQKYAGGNDIDSVAWYESNSGDIFHMVGTKASNGLGIYDMSGNVWEWCEDVYDENAYSKHGRNNPVMSSGSSDHVSRGGSFFESSDYMNTTFRSWDNVSFSIIGFRLCLSRVRQSSSSDKEATITEPKQEQPLQESETLSQPASSPDKEMAITEPKPGQPWKDPVTGIEFVWVPKGCFQMGSNSGEADEKPVHEVCVDGFWMGKYEVTQGQWEKIMGDNPSSFKSGDDYPVEEVSWEDTKKFISKLKQQPGNRFSLPTEAQWEYAARSGGKDQKYAGGNNIDSVAWYLSNSGGKTHRVGTKASNGLDIYDMSGNVSEWCEDVYDKKAYPKHDRNNPVVTSGSSSCVLRGGNWLSTSYTLRSARRYSHFTDRRDEFIGLRLCLSRVRQ
jgi:formylglycine-generating enzyme required for sulfatase activity